MMSDEDRVLYTTLSEYLRRLYEIRDGGVEEPDDLSIAVTIGGVPTFINSDQILPSTISSKIAHVSNMLVKVYLRANPHVEHKRDEDDRVSFVHDDDRAHYILSTPGAGR